MAKKRKKGPQIPETPEEEFDLPKGLELLQGNGWGKKILDWLRKNFSAVILPIIALIILGGGIYLYSQQRGGGLEIPEEEVTTGITVDLEKEKAVPEEKQEVEKQVEEEKVAATEEIAPEEEVKGGLVETEEEVVEGKVYKFAAERGEGITHLARKALKQYLLTSAKDLNLTPEHKIYIEDYMQNRTGSQMLHLGEVINFPESLIKEAIAEAQKLTDAQLQNLTQYAQLVPSLSY